MRESTFTCAHHMDQIELSTTCDLIGHKRLFCFSTNGSVRNVVGLIPSFPRMNQIQRFSEPWIHLSDSLVDFYDSLSYVFLRGLNYSKSGVSVSQIRLDGVEIFIGSFRYIPRIFFAYLLRSSPNNRHTRRQRCLSTMTSPMLQSKDFPMTICTAQVSVYRQFLLSTPSNSS